MPGDRLASLRAQLGTRLRSSSSTTVALPAEVEGLVAREYPLLTPGDRRALVEGVMADARGLGALEAVLADPTVTDLMVNGAGPVWVERAGALERLPITLDDAAIHHVIEKVVAPLGLRVDRSCPIVDARLPDGSRVNVVVPPLAVDGPCLTIRQFGARDVPLGEFAPPGVVSLLDWAVRARLNIVVCGGTGSGKTTLLNAMAAAIPDGERLVTVEDAAELRLPGDHVVRLEARPGNADGSGATTIRDLVRNALRMRPDRIIVGEVRGPEALDMLQAMNTGHEGSMSTCHANGPDDALRRIETMVLMDEVRLPLAAVRAQLEASVDLVVVVARRADGRRRIVAVAEVIEADGDDGGSNRAARSEEARDGGRGDGRHGRTRTLAGDDGLRSLPHRRPRHPVEPVDAAWIESRS